MKLFVFICLTTPWLVFSQKNDNNHHFNEDVQYIILKGDSIPKKAIDLDEVLILPKLRLKNLEARKLYYRLHRKTLKVYPYAKLAAERLEEMNDSLSKLTKKRHQKKYTKQVQKYIESEFAGKLKKMSRTEGQILIKLIHRQTGQTAFELVKELRNGWRAFWFNSTANVFDISLKRKFNPVDVKEDYYIEDILLRNLQRGRIKYQKPAVMFDFYSLTNKWMD